MPITVIEGRARLDLPDDEALSVVTEFGAIYIHRTTEDHVETFEVPADAREWLARALWEVRP